MFKTTRAERLSYGGFFLGQNILYILQLQFLTYFYTEEVGLSLASSSTLLLIARIWDACNDPIMGAIVDKCHFKGGKYMPWLKTITFILPLTLVFVFVNVGGTYDARLAYAYITYIIFGMTYTVSDMPLFSLSTAMTDQVYERDKLLSYGRFGAALAAISTAVFMSIKGAIGWTWTVAAYCLACFLFMLPLRFTAKERLAHKREYITFKKIFTFLFKNKYLLIFYIGYLFLNATNTLQTVAAYFAKANLGDEGMTTVLLGVCIVPILIISPLLPMLIKKLGKRRLTLWSCAISVALCIIQYFLGYDNFALFLAVAAVRVMFMQTPLLIYGMFTADCIEYGAYKTGVRGEGISFSAQTFVTKLSGGICGVIVLGMLSAYGYAEGAAAQAESALEGIWLTMNIVPIAGFVGMFVMIAFFYKLTERDVSKMIAEMKINHDNA